MCVCVCVCVCVCKVYTILPKFITLGVLTMHGFGENEQVCVLIQITSLLQLSPTCPDVTLPQPLLLIFLYTAPPYTSTHSLVQWMSLSPPTQSPRIYLYFHLLLGYSFPPEYVFLSHILFSLPHFVSTTPQSPRPE